PGSGAPNTHGVSSRTKHIALRSFFLRETDQTAPHRGSPRPNASHAIIADIATRHLDRHKTQLHPPTGQRRLRMLGIGDNSPRTAGLASPVWHQWGAHLQQHGT
ncbi:unnamed protein product, partial [Ectocarpus fasciculatus]